MKILLINPPIRENEKPSVFPSGIGYLAAYLIKEGYDVGVLDINGYRYNRGSVVNILKKHLLENKMEVVGIGGLITCYDYIKWLIQIIKKIKPKTKVIVGGGIGSSIPERCINNLKADIVVTGEGEITIVNLLKKLENNKRLSEVRGILFKKGDKIIRTPPQERIKNLDELPFPSWHLFPMQIYLKNQFEVEAINTGRKSISIIGGRGCPYHCTFCYEIFNHVAIKRSIKNIIEEVKTLQRRYNIKIIYFIEDLFAINKDWITNFCDELIRQKIKLKWLCTARVNIADEEMLKKMKDAGCILVNFGIESGSQKMLNIMKKGITLEQASKAINITRKIGLKLNLSFMIGFPEETKETLEETIKFCIENDIHLTSIFFVTPYPGTALYEQVKKIGLIKNEEEFISKLGDATELTINLTRWSDEELFKLRNHVIKKIRKAYFKKHKTEQLRWYFKKIKWFSQSLRKRGIKEMTKKILIKIKNKLGDKKW